MPVYTTLLSAAVAGPAATVGFVDATGEAGIDFVHINGATGRKYLPETMAPGVAFVDSDGDGALDVYLVNGASLPAGGGADRPVNALYRNVGSGRFAEIADAAGAGDTGFGMGCAAADYDNDGDQDLLVTNFGANALYRNDGNGRFDGVGREVGVEDTSWSAGAAFFDGDNDGDLDLYVANYVHFDLHRVNEAAEAYLKSPVAAVTEGVRTYPHPRNYPGAADVFYRNEGDGTFADVSAAAGLSDTVATEGRGLGVVAGDFDGDGDQDVYVANDAVRNFLYRNDGDGTFSEIGALAGVGYGRDGQKEAGMGVDAGDYDRDGLPDLVVTNFEQEPVGLYENRGSLAFVSASFSSGLGAVTLRPLSFGVLFLDYDSDGDEDLFVANGHVLDNIELFAPSGSYGQPNLLLRNGGPDARRRYRFEDASIEAGVAQMAARASRGCALGDYDDDGDIDILVANCGQPARLLRNDGGNRAGNWLMLRLVGTAANRDAIGARVRVRAADLVLVKDVRGSKSYLSQSDLRVHFGLGDRPVDAVEITWPGGLRETWRDLQANRCWTLVEGTSGRGGPTQTVR